MKKKVLFCAFCFAIACAGMAVSYDQKSTTNDLLMKRNVEALSDGENVGNTGPGKIKSCSSGGGYRKFCMCENRNPCTESACE